METLIDRPNFQVQVRDIDRMAVCRFCKGTSTKGVMLYYDPYLRTPLHSIWARTWCRECDGDGYWRMLDDLPAEARETEAEGS